MWDNIISVVCSVNRYITYSIVPPIKKFVIPEIYNTGNTIVHILDGVNVIPEIYNTGYTMFYILDGIVISPV